MKIIFDNEKQKEDFIMLNCPKYIGLEDVRGDCNDARHHDCKKCWEETVEMEVEE